jgi:mRNA interferase MazF
MIQRGNIVICSFPFSDFSVGKLRPALVVSNSSINGSEDVIVMGISTQEQEQWQGIKVELQDLHDGTLAHTSFIHCHKIHLISKSLIYKIVAQVSPSVLESVVQRFQNIISAS